MSRHHFVQGAALFAGLCALLSPTFAQAAPPAPPPPGLDLLVWIWTNIIVPGLGTW